METKVLEALRKDYRMAALDETHIEASPIEQFKKWLLEATSSGMIEPNAMSLSTVSKSGKPSSRIVLLKGIENEGFIFYSNYESRKGNEIGGNPYCALLFFWDVLERQIRIEGSISKVSDATSIAYFDQRPLGSRLGAIASPQSKVVTGRKALEELFRKTEEKYAGNENPPRPAHWGGYKVIPDYFEFWQGRENRMHDRIVYKKEGMSWAIERLAP